jgi:hypothetical protein
MNPIEMVFNKAKLYFKKAKLHTITNRLPLDYKALILKAFTYITKTDVQKMCQHSWKECEI